MVGLYKYGTTALLLKLSSLTVLSILCAIQLNYLHDDFMRIYDPSKAKQKNTEKESVSESLTDVKKKKKRIYREVLKSIEKFYESFLVFLEIHFHKGLLIYTFYVSCKEVSLKGVIRKLCHAK
jgi:hypothetical protein